MSTMVIGASGQVGALLYQLCSRRGQCVGTYAKTPMPSLTRLDISDRSAVEQLIGDLRPSCCYLPGSLTHVDYAEQHPDECHAINVEGTRHVAHAMQHIGGKLVFFSTEYLFGDRETPWTEDESPQPAGVYARSKRDGEKIVRQLLPDAHLILRTSWVFGPDLQKKNFFWRVRQTLLEGKPLRVSNDQFGQPTFGPDLAETAQRLVDLGACGTYHVVGPRTLSRLAWTLTIAEGLGLPKDKIEGLPTTTFPQGAPRPLRAQLNRNKLLEFLGDDPIRMPETAVKTLGHLSATRR